MCGIFGVHRIPEPASYRGRALQLSRCQRHRGPDWSGCVVTQDSVLCHERLAIVGVDTGAQPLVSDDGKLVLAVNGEIYNHRILRKNLKDANAVFKTHSDCEVLLHLYREQLEAEQKGEKAEPFASLLDGMFSFALVDTSVTPSRLIAARDPIGITTLYYGRSSKVPGAIWISSELKALEGECDEIHGFPPGHYYDSSKPEGQELQRYYNPRWISDDAEGAERPTKPADLTLIRETLEAAVRKRLMSEVPYGVLLSGGLDSSLIAAIAARETNKVAEAQRQRYQQRRATRAAASGEKDDDIGVDEMETLAAWPRLHSFSIGLPGAPDRVAAQQAADYLGTVHHSFNFSCQEALDAVSDVIYHLETFDVTTIRASIPMYLLSRKIKAMGVKMVLSGEGSDELFGGYLYFHAAPSEKEFHNELVSRVKNLHTADCLRANKSTLSFGLEARVPYLDAKFVSMVMDIDAKDKMFSKGSAQTMDKDGHSIIEKYILRKAFALVPEGDERPYLPDSILWRQKEQFSDGVGKAHIDALRESGEKSVSDEDMANAAKEFPHLTPDTKEALWYRRMFHQHFPSAAAESTVRKWVPRTDWGCPTDPSGLAQNFHNDHADWKADAVKTNGQALS